MKLKLKLKLRLADKPEVIHSHANSKDFLLFYLLTNHTRCFHSIRYLSLASFSLLSHSDKISATAELVLTHNDAKYSEFDMGINKITWKQQ